MNRFRKKPAEVEAVQFLGHNTREIARWADPSVTEYKLPKGWWLKVNKDGFSMVIKTQEGETVVPSGDWIIKTDAGEFRSCTNDVFRKTYEGAA